MSIALAKKLLEQRATAHEEGKKIIDAADKEGRALTAEESESFDKITAQMDSLRSQADRLVAFEEDQRNIEESLRGAPGAGREEEREDPIAEQLRSLLGGQVSGFDYAPSGAERNEVRAMTKGTPSAGGVTVPTTFYGQLMEHMVDTSAILSAGATVLYTSAGGEITVPVTLSAPEAAQVGEGQTIPKSDPVLGSRALRDYKYAVLSQVSRELADDSAFDIEGFVARQAGRAVGNKFGEKLISGTGTNEPTGLIQSTTLGKTGPAAGPTWDDMIDLFYSVIGPYRRSPEAGWLINDTTAAHLRKVKDGEGRYIWQPAVTVGAPDTIEGKAVFTDPGVPPVGAGNKSVLFGDISAYFARIVNGVRFERSDEFAFDKDLITYRTIIRGDGILTDQTGAIKHFAGAAG